jgi:protein-L-isoaspartate(D-aspartate) O-methyltransferase
LVSTDTVLEIGTGSGYFTSLLATLGKHVTSIEIEPTFSHRAAKKLSAHNVRNVTLEVGDGARGWDKGAPFNVIVLTGSVPVLSDRFVKSLKEGGRLIAIVGQAPAMQACFTRRLKGENLEMRSLFETVVPPLKNAPAHSAFEF